MANPDIRQPSPPSYSSDSNSYTSCHFPSEDPYALHLYQTAQCTYASHAAISCYFYCKALDISDRYGVWECILYLMNMFHNHGVDHLNIANILLLSYYFQIKRIEKRDNAITNNLSKKKYAQKFTLSNPRINSTSIGTLLKKKEINSKLITSTSLSQKHPESDSKDFVSQSSKKIPLPQVHKSSITTVIDNSYKQYSKNIFAHTFSNTTLPRFIWNSIMHSAAFHFLSMKNIFARSPSTYKGLEHSTAKTAPINSCRSWVPLRSLDDSRLTRTLFVSCWLAFTWIEDIKIPLKRWCDLLRIVPLSKDEQSYIEQIGFQQTFVDEVVAFWEDLGCFLHVSQIELDDAYLKMLGLVTASYPFTPYLTYNA